MRFNECTLLLFCFLFSAKLLNLICGLCILQPFGSKITRFNLKKTITKGCVYSVTVRFSLKKHLIVQNNSVLHEALKVVRLWTNMNIPRRGCLRPYLKLNIVLVEYHHLWCIYLYMKWELFSLVKHSKMKGNCCIKRQLVTQTDPVCCCSCVHREICHYNW